MKSSSQQPATATHQSEQRLRALIEQSAAGIAQTDLNGRIVFANKRYCQIVGYSMEDVLELRVHDLTYAEDLPETTGLVSQAAIHGNEYAMEKRYVRKDGSIIWVNVSASVLKDEEGKPRSIMGVVVDITDRKQLEERLRESEERLRLGLDAGDTGTWDWDIRTNHITWSERVYQFHGLTPETFHGTVEDFEHVIHPEDRQRVSEAIQTAIKNRCPYDIDFRVVRYGSEAGWLTTRGKVYYDQSGNAIRMLGATRDITQQKLAEQERDALLASERASRTEAERANRLKDEFLATVSHELRTPLNAILGYAQVLRHADADKQEVAEGLDVIERNARVQAQIIEDILDMSRIVSGKLRLDMQQVNLAGVIDAALQTVQPTADAKRIQIVRPGDPVIAMVTGDAARLQQIVWNLLNNAIKFTSDGEQVRIGLARVEAHLELAISDNGRGIGSAFLPYVFDKFRQADATTTRKHGGLGLGLAIVKNLVELHGGVIGVDSAGEGHGATFVVKLPLASVHGESPSDSFSYTRVSSMPAPLRDRPSLVGFHVLVVDDERDTRELVRRLIEDCDATVTTAASAIEALQQLDRQHIDVIVSDIGMPGIDGYELIRRIRARGPDHGGDVPAMALTAFARSEDRMRALAAGYQTHITKPVEPIDLVFAVANLVGKAGG